MFYWTIDCPGLTETQCRELATTAREGGIEALEVDPRGFLTLHLDRASVEGLFQALRGSASSPTPAGIGEVLQEWLEWSPQTPAE